MKKILIFILFFFIIAAIFFPGYLSRFNFFLGTLLIRNNEHYVNENDYYPRRLNNRKRNRRDYSENDDIYEDDYEDDYNDDYNAKKNKKPNSNEVNYLKKRNDDSDKNKKSDSTADERSSKEKGIFAFLDIVRHILEFFISIITSIIKSIISIIISPFLLPLIMFFLIIIIIFFVFKNYCSSFLSDCQCFNDLISNIFSCWSTKKNHDNDNNKQKSNAKKNNGQAVKKFKKELKKYGINENGFLLSGNNVNLGLPGGSNLHNNFLLNDGK